MDDHEEQAELSSEPVRSRWSPKPEQILILESIFNSGMVNPPKDETVRIRRMLEKFGSVGDANVFYWFQNRRSRSRRRQRQIQAAAAAAEEQPIHYANTETANNFSTSPIVSNYPMIDTAGPGSSSSFGLASDGYISFSGHPAGVQELHQTFGPWDTSNSHCHSRMITVFINGVATEVGRGPLDMKAMFGGDYALVHSSGVGVELNENGFLVHSLCHGESYFLVPRHS